MHHRVKLIDLHEVLARKKLESILKLDSEGVLENQLDHLKQMIKNHFSGVRELYLVENAVNISKKPETNRIKRNYDGLTNPKLISNPDRDFSDQKKLDQLSLGLGGIPLELLNLANGSYTVEEIFLLMHSQYSEVTLDDVIFMVQLFQKEKTLIVD